MWGKLETECVFLWGVGEFDSDAGFNTVIVIDALAGSKEVVSPRLLH